jgi:hypothetical protein
MLASFYLVAEVEQPRSQMSTLSLVSASTVAESIIDRAAATTLSSSCTQLGDECGLGSRTTPGS